eukprot:14394028-Ditylum_brightwellii.AAC.1
MICNKIAGVVLGSVADAPIMEGGGELIVIYVNGVKGCVDLKAAGTLVDARAFINKYFNFDLRFPSFLFQAGSLLVDKCQDINTLAWHLIGKPVTLVAEEGELLLHGYNKNIHMTDVKGTDNLSDVRSYIDEYFDDGAMPSNYLFQVGSVIIPRSGEVNTPAWPCLGRAFVIVSVYSEGTGSTQSKATNIIEDV